MNAFAAIVLVCLTSVPPDACDEDTAVDVQSVGVANEVDCTWGWQEVVARSPRAREIGSTAYVKTLCRRLPPPEPRPGKDRGDGG